MEQIKLDVNMKLSDITLIEKDISDKFVEAVLNELKRDIKEYKISDFINCNKREKE